LLGVGIATAVPLAIRHIRDSDNAPNDGSPGDTATATNGVNTGGTGLGGAGSATRGRAGFGAGAGLYSKTAPPLGASLNSVTFATNQASRGANLSNAGTGTLTVVNSIVSNPVGGANCDGTVTSGGYNIDSGTSCGFTQSGDLQSVDPQLGLLQDNGGPTTTHAPAQTSPAVDHGTSGGLTTDQRGLPRPSDFAGIANAGDGSDIGAVELEAPPAGEPPPTTPPALEVEVSAAKKQKGLKLRATVTCSKACEIDAKGKGEAGGDKFKTKTASLTLEAGVATKVKLKLKKGDREDVAGEKGKATIVVTATAGADVATDSSKVKLKP
jgi:hypothetical protein